MYFTQYGPFKKVGIVALNMPDWLSNQYISGDHPLLSSLDQFLIGREFHISISLF